MKFFVSAFFLILSPFSSVLSLDCYMFFLSSKSDSCRSEGQSAEGSEDEKLCKEFSCLRDDVDERKVSCKEGYTECLTVTFELKDQTEVKVKGCDNSEHEICGDTKSSLISQPDYRNFIKNSHCNFCTSDYCNGATPPPPPPPPRQQKHSASLSAVFAPPTSTIVIAVLIIHILL